MFLKKPRVEPLGAEQWDAETRELLARSQVKGRVLNIFSTLAHHPKLLKRWMVFAAHVLSKSTLPPRDREILILRIGWLCRAEYEWGQHVLIGREAGLSDEDIDRIKAGPEADGWDPFESVLLRAVDELHGQAMISDATWGSLAQRYNTQQSLDLIFAVGQYNLISMALNTLGVQLDEGIPGFNDGKSQSAADPDRS
jgi:4-carboxymuconolactone decarboxylase